MPCRALLDQIAEAYSHADRNALMALYREDALRCSAAEPDTTVGRDELFGRADVLQRTQLIGAIDLISIDEAAGLIRANARIAVGQGQYRTTERVWLLTFKEGLVLSPARSRIARRSARSVRGARHGSWDAPSPPSPRVGNTIATVGRVRLYGVAVTDNNCRLLITALIADGSPAVLEDSRANLRRAGPAQGDNGAQSRGAGRAAAEHSQAASERPDRAASSAHERPTRTQLVRSRPAGPVPTTSSSVETSRVRSTRTRCG